MEKIVINGGVGGRLTAGGGVRRRRWTTKMAGILWRQLCSMAAAAFDGSNDGRLRGGGKAAGAKRKTQTQQSN